MMIGRIWLVIGVLLLVGQEVPLFPRVWLHRGSDVRDALWGELLEAPRPDGSTVPVLLHDGGHGRLVLLLHGNGETAAMMVPYAAALDRLGWDTAAMEYRGYASVPGWPTESRLGADVAAARRALEARGYPPDRVVLHGRSIGGGVAATWLDDADAAGLVLESSFDSMDATVRDRWLGLFFPIGWMLRSPFPTDARLVRRPVPVLQIHDTTDPVIGLHRAQALHDLVGTELIVTTGHPHGAPLVLELPEVRERWAAWLDERVPSTETAQ